MAKERTGGYARLEDQQRLAECLSKAFPLGDSGPFSVLQKAIEETARKGRRY